MSVYYFPNQIPRSKIGVGVDNKFLLKLDHNKEKFFWIKLLQNNRVSSLLPSYLWTLLAFLSPKEMKLFYIKNLVSRNSLFVSTTFCFQAILSPQLDLHPISPSTQPTLCLRATPQVRSWVSTSDSLSEGIMKNLQLDSELQARLLTTPPSDSFKLFFQELLLHRILSFIPNNMKIGSCSCFNSA